jgi:sec-independent protein translocase protein TatA
VGDLLAPAHLLILLVIVLVVFGPSKLAGLGAALGTGIKDFKRAMNDLDPLSNDSANSASKKATGDRDH